jgi:hypothetical protein
MPHHIVEVTPERVKKNELRQEGRETMVTAQNKMMNGNELILINSH